VVHARPYRDKDFLVDLFTRKRGRFRGVLRGFRSLKGGKAARVQPGQSISVAWSGRNELKTITALEGEGQHRHYDSSALLSLLYLNELLYRLLADADPYPLLFDAYGQCLNSLCHAHSLNGQATLLRTFEFRLLSELGYGIDLHREQDGQTPLCEQSWYRFDPEQGFIRNDTVMDTAGVRSSAPAPADVSELNHGLFSGSVLARMRKSPVDDEQCLHAARLITRSAIRALLGKRGLGAHAMLKSAT
jgi:DNA repair protein RecO (recombination protein O)